MAPDCSGPAPAGGFLDGGGEMGALMRAHDWTASPLGPPEAWPDALKLSVSICLRSRFPILLWWGADCLMLYNDAYRPILGSTKHPAALGRPGVETFPEIWTIIEPPLRGVLARGEASWAEDQLLELHRSGYAEEAYFTYSYSPIRQLDGSMGGVFTAVTETTERVLGERRLRTLRELAERCAGAKTVEAACAAFAAVLDSGNPDLPFALLYLPAETPGAVRLLAAPGLSAGVGTGEDPWRAAAVLRDGQAALVERAPVAGGHRGDGAGWPADAALALPVAGAGQTSEVAAVLVAGINPRRKLDDAYRGFLELVAGQLATALASARAHEQERQRAEALAEIDRAKTAFFANVSHEFRTPLTLLLGPIEDAMADPALPVRQRERLDMAMRNALRLQRLVNSLLQFSRIEAGRSRVRFEPIDLATTTAELASTFRSAIERGGLTLRVDCPSLGRPVHVDRDMWEQIVLNLLSNAFKFTFSGVIEVALRARGEMAELTVRDTGCGISESELPHLFDRFHRVEGAVGRTHEGSGIGLAVVQELAKLHGGAVRAESSPGRGSAFTVAVPLGVAHIGPDQLRSDRAASSLVGAGAPAGPFVEEALRWLPDEAAGDPAPADRPPGAAERSALILVVDDNSDMRGYLRRLLSPHYRVRVAADGAAAMTAIRAEQPDLVLSDVMMPRLDGFGLLHTLRSDPALQAIPVILLSARAGDEASVEGLQAGADDYLTKPFAARELLARVASNLGLAQARLRAIEQQAEHLTALQRLNETLEARVRGEVAAREAAQAQLAQAQRIEALGQLAGGIAHDFNNVLQAVTGGLSLIGRRADHPDTVRQLAQMATDAAARGSAITGRLLAFARQGELRAQPVDCAALLHGLHEMLAHTLGGSITVRLDLPPAGLETGQAGPCLLADRGQLETVLVNLAINARDAMPDGGTLTFAAHDETVPTAAGHRAGLAAGDYVRVSAADDGTGMDAATLARAAEPFFTTKPIGKGTGLGLAMARGFAQQSGGGFAIDSAPGQGTTVMLWLPRADPASIETGLVEPLTAAPSPPVAAHVLVVDDDRLVRETLAGQLESHGYRVTQASDGLSALSRLDAGDAFDLLVTDYAMPGMNGLTLIREARQRRPALPACLLTGYADSAVGLGAAELAAERTLLLRKPTSGEDLLGRAARLVGGELPVTLLRAS